MHKSNGIGLAFGMVFNIGAVIKDNIIKLHYDYKTLS
jgi:hypothetical protein